MKQFVLASLFFLVTPSLCFAQAKRIPVAVAHSGDDQVGQSFAFALKEAIRGSQSFTLVDNDLKQPRIVLKLTSVDGSVGTEKGIMSAISIAFVYDSLQTPGQGILLVSTVIICGRDRIESCAKKTLPDIDLKTTEFSLI